jgi:hypothetical protein
MIPYDSRRDQRFGARIWPSHQPEPFSWRGQRWNKAVIAGGKQLLWGNAGQLGELQKGLDLFGTSHVVSAGLVLRAFVTDPAQHA